ncbi:MAG: TonB-dependent receptor [Hyphomonadaceae bacterium]|nr:TonB-dependent receptor [Hyphomonadaceae bacterium]
MRFATTGALLCAGDPALTTLNGNGFAQILNSLREPIKREQLISDTRLTYETARNSLSAGVMFMTLSHDRALASSLFLSEVKSSGASILDIVAVAPGTRNILGFLSEGGVVRHGQFRGDDQVEVNSVSIYVNDEFKITEKLRLDGGLRWEKSEYQGSSLNNLGNMLPVVGALTSTGVDTDNILANNFANRRFGDGTSTRFQTTYEDIAWTVGFNYTFTNSIAMYGRYAEGFQTPRADRLGDFFQGGQGIPIETTELTEVGARFSGDNLAASATLFRTFFPTYLAGGFGVDASNTQILNQAELSVVGVEFDVTWKPIEQVSINAVGVFSDNELNNFTTISGAAFNGKQLARNPSQQMRISGVYTPFDRLDLFGNVRFIGERFGANDNIVKFDACTIVGGGLTYRLTEQVSFQLTATNLTEEVCFTEGNPRATIAQNQLDVGFARPMAGRRFLSSIQFNF